MDSADLWSDIEGKIKSLTSSLESLPEDVRAKATELISQQITSANTAASRRAEAAEQCEKSSVQVTVTSELQSSDGCLQDIDTTDYQSSVDDHVSMDCKDVPSSLTPTALGTPAGQSKRDRRVRNGHVPADVREKTPVTSAVAVRSSQRIQDRRELHVKKELEIADSKSARRRSEDTKRHRRRGRKPKVELNCEIDKKPDIKLEAVELVGTVESDLLKIEDDISVTGAAAETTDNARSENKTRSTILPPPRKRGRRSKKELEELVEAGILQPHDKKNVKFKKPVGRPRFSTYPSGYVPRPKCYRCPVCARMLATRQSFREHHRRHTGECYVCDLCGQKFTTNSGFLLHKKYHSDDPQIYKCNICHYTVRSQKLLDEHYSCRHDPNRPRDYICYICGKGFHTSVLLEKHLLSHSTSKPYHCDECDFATAYPGGLAKHKYNVHKTDGRKMFECEICHVQLRSKGTYVEHIGRHFNQRNKICEICSKSFPTASQLAAQRRCHNDPKIPCEICGKLVRNKHKMKIHLLVHSGQKDFACPYCNYITYVKHNLKKHCAARHKVEYPPVEHPRMKKFALDDTLSVAAALTDPVALHCINKIVVDSGQTVSDILDESSSAALLSSSSDTTIKQPSDDTDMEVVPDAEPSPNNAGFVISQAKEISQQATSELNVIADGNHQTVVLANPDMLSMPLFSLPLVAYGVPADFAAAGTIGADEKTFMTLATVSRPNASNFESHHAVVLAPTYSNL